MKIHDDIKNRTCNIVTFLEALQVFSLRQEDELSLKCITDHFIPRFYGQAMESAQRHWPYNGSSI
jgi:hypothetical protein